MNEINNIKLGNSQVNKIYLGENLVWKYEEPDLTAPFTSVYPDPTKFYSAGNKFWLEVSEASNTYYTLDGSTPTTNSTLFTEPITLNVTTTIKYFSVDLNGNAESWKENTVNIVIAPVTTISPASTIQNTIPFTVSLSATNNPTATYYKLGATGTQQTYTAPFSVNQNSAGVNSQNIKIIYWSVNANGTEVENSITYDTTGAIPSTPTPTIINGENQVTLNWTATTNTLSYSVFRSTTQGVLGDVLIPSQYQTQTTFTDTTAIGGTTYYYTVRSANLWRVADSVQLIGEPTAGTGTQIVTRTLKPTALWSTNMTPNNVTYLQDNPASVDANNLIPTSTTVAPYAEVYFGKLSDGVLEGTQKIRLSYVDDVNWVGLYIDVLENGTVKKSFASTPTYNGYNNLVAEFSFDASIITDKTGINVAIMVRGILFDGLTITSLRAVEWLATVKTGGGQPVETKNWRYVRYIGHGDNTTAGTSRLIEIKANGGGVNYMKNLTPISINKAPDTGGAITTVTDENIAMSAYPIWWSGDGIPTMVYDLGSAKALDNLQIWMYSKSTDLRQPRFELDVSTDNVVWKSVANYTNSTIVQDPVEGFTFTAPPN